MRTERCLVRVIEFNMSMFRFVLLNQFTIMLEVAVALLFLFCLKLKSGLYKRIFPTGGGAKSPANAVGCLKFSWSSGYYHPCAKPMTKLTVNGPPFVWTDDYEASSHTLK